MDSNTQKKLGELAKQCTDLVDKTADEVFKGEGIKNLLNIMANCYNQPYYNQLLIYKQKRSASDVRGKAAWEAIGGKIKEGEKPILILNPFFGLGNPGKQKKDEKGQPVFDESDGIKIPIWENEPGWYFEFHPVPVFDISQVSGDVKSESPVIDFSECIRNGLKLTIVPTDDTSEFPRNSKRLFKDNENTLYIRDKIPDKEKMNEFMRFCVEYKVSEGKTCDNTDVLMHMAIHVLSLMSGQQGNKFITNSAGKMKDKPVEEKKALLNDINLLVGSIIFESGNTYINSQETAFINHLLVTDDKTYIPVKEITVDRKIRDTHPEIAGALRELMTEKIMMSKNECVTDLFDKKWNRQLFTYPPFKLIIEK